MPKSPQLSCSPQLFIIFLEEYKNMFFPNISNRPTHLDNQTQQILTQSTPNSTANRTHKLSKQTNLQQTQTQKFSWETNTQKNTQKIQQRPMPESPQLSCSSSLRPMAKNPSSPPTHGQGQSQNLKLRGAVLLLVACSGSSFRLSCLIANEFFFFIFKIWLLK